MKKIHYRSGGGMPTLKKLSLIMKLNFFMILLAVLQVSANVSAQKTRLDLKMKNVTFSDVLDAIEQQTDVYFFYNKSQINEKKMIDVDFQNNTIEEVMQQLSSTLSVTY